MLNDFNLLENNNNSLEANATHILLCGGLYDLLLFAGLFWKVDVRIPFLFSLYH